MTATVDACIPVYNGAKYLEASIRSVLAQTLQDFRLVVVDNCSTDATPEIARSFDDARVEYVRNERNLGLVGNFNRCLSLARAPYVVLWHHDDVMLPDNLRRKVEVLDAHRNIGFVHSNIYQMDARGHVTGTHWAADSTRDYVASGHTFFERLIRRFNLVCCPSVLARRTCYQRVGSYTSVVRNTVDWDMWLRMALEFDVACIGEPLIMYRLHDSNASNAYLGLAGFREEWTVKARALAAARGRIVDWNGLRHDVIRAQIDEILHRAYQHAGRGHGREALSYCALACQLSAATILRPGLWALLLRVAAGGPGADLYRHVVPAGARARAAQLFHRQFWARR